MIEKVDFVDCEEFEIGNSFSKKLVENDLLMVPDLLHGIDIPLRKFLKYFLEIPKLFDKILEYIKTLAD